MSDNQFYYGIFYPDNQGDFVVFVKSPNDSFQSQILRLAIIMLSVLYRIIGHLFLEQVSFQGCV
jgi:hypothetical protein